MGYQIQQEEGCHVIVRSIFFQKKRLYENEGVFVPNAIIIVTFRLYVIECF